MCYRFKHALQLCADAVVRFSSIRFRPSGQTDLTWWVNGQSQWRHFCLKFLPIRCTMLCPGHSEPPLGWGWQSWWSNMEPWAGWGNPQGRLYKENWAGKCPRNPDTMSVKPLSLPFNFISVYMPLLFTLLFSVLLCLLLALVAQAVLDMIFPSWTACQIFLRGM